MFNFTHAVNIFGNLNCYLSTGPLNSDVIYCVTFRADGSVEGFVS